MSDLNWCTFCDSAITVFSNSLYCSEACLRADALNHHPLLGYDYAELKDFPRSSPALSSSASTRSTASSPSLSPVSSFTLPSPLKLKANTLSHATSPPRPNDWLATPPSTVTRFSTAALY